MVRQPVHAEQPGTPDLTEHVPAASLLALSGNYHPEPQPGDARRMQAPAVTLEMSATVHAVIAEHLPSGRPTRSRIARALGLSTRTFQRRLAQEGTSFDQLVQEVRLRVARHMLGRPELTIDVIADATGFYDRTSFCRAFRTWTGITPGAFRALLERRREAVSVHFVPEEVGLVLRRPGELASGASAEPHPLSDALAHLPASVGSRIAASPVSALLRQPLMVPVSEGGGESAYCLAVDLVEGCSLQQLLGCRLSPGLACYLIAQVAATLALSQLRADYGGRAHATSGELDPRRVLIAGDATVRFLDTWWDAPELGARGRERTVGSPQRRARPSDDVLALGQLLHSLMAAPVGGEMSRADGVDAELERVMRRIRATPPERGIADCGEVAVALAPVIARYGAGRAELQRLVASARQRAHQGRSSTPRGALGSVRITEVAPSVLVYTMTGYLDVSWVARFEATAEAALARGYAVEQFFDATAMTGYDAEFRRRMTDWHNMLRPHTRGLHVLVGSKLVAMAIASVNMFTGRLLTPHSTRTSFEAALDRSRA